jgi:hypothetical protein
LKFWRKQAVQSLRELGAMLGVRLLAGKTILRLGKKFLSLGKWPFLAIILGKSIDFWREGPLFLLHNQKAP